MVFKSKSSKRKTTKRCAGDAGRGETAGALGVGAVAASVERFRTENPVMACYLPLSKT